MRRPAEVYQPSPRAYHEHPAVWDYPTGSEVKQLNAQGLLHDGGRRWFVCEARAGQRVRLERLEGKVLVSYRHMYIREIDTDAGWTRPMVVAHPLGAAPFGPGNECKGCLDNEHFSGADSNYGRMKMGL